MRALSFGVIAFLSAVFLTACSEQALENTLSTQDVSADSPDVSSSLLSSDPKGPAFALINYEKNTASVPLSCDLVFAPATALPESFYVNTAGTASMTWDKVLDACKAQVESAQELGRVFFSKHEPISFGPHGGQPTHNPHGIIAGAVEGTEPPSHRGAAPVALSEFLQAALEFESLADANSFLSCAQAGWEDVFNRAVGTHGVSESGFVSSSEENMFHAHYDLTVMGSTNYVVQLATVKEVADRFYVIMATGMDASAEDAETYTHMGVKETCRTAGVVSNVNGRGFIALPESN